MRKSINADYCFLETSGFWFPEYFCWLGGYAYVTPPSLRFENHGVLFRMIG